jgi:hypothetical protein
METKWPTWFVKKVFHSENQTLRILPVLAKDRLGSRREVAGFEVRPKDDAAIHQRTEWKSIKTRLTRWKNPMILEGAKEKSYEGKCD